MRIFIARKLGPTDLTWEEKNSADYRYYPDDDTKLKNFIKQGGKKKMNKDKKVNIPVEELVNSSIVVNGISIPVEELVGCYKVVKSFQEGCLPYYTQVEGEYPHPINAKRVNHDFNCLLKQNIKKYRD